MKTLIVEDDFTNRLLLQQLLKSYGLPHIEILRQLTLIK
jgi:CheY-like chemotaxis protein